MVNPFDNQFSNLVHIVSGLEASPKVQEAARNMWDIGEAEVNDYLDNLLSDGADIYQTLKKTKLETFGTQTQNITVKNAKDEIISIKSTKDFFVKLVLLAKSRDIDMKNVLKYSLRPYPSPLASYDGNMVKTQKSKLLEVIEKKAKVDCVTSIPNRSCLIIDAMALLQALKNIPDTFKELTSTILKSIVTLASKFGCSRVDVVCDRYPTESIKGAERLKRGTKDAAVFSIFGGDNQKTPRQWKKFLKSGKNKENIMEFFFESLKSVPHQTFGGKEIYLCHSDKCDRFQVVGGTVIVQNIGELTCDHEEADTRMGLHTFHASQNGFADVVIASPDTDVFVIMLHVSTTCHSSIYFLTGTGVKRRMIPVTTVQQKLGNQLCEALIGFHAFSGMFKFP